MRIVRSPDLPAVVLVKGRGVRALAIPESLPASEVLELASLVLSTSEFEELRHAVQSPPPLRHGRDRFDGSIQPGSLRGEDGEHDPGLLHGRHDPPAPRLIGCHRLFQQDVVAERGERLRRLGVHAVLRADQDRVREPVSPARWWSQHVRRR